MKHERDADQAIAREVDTRINHAAISLAANDRMLLLHYIRYVHFTDLRQKHRTIELFGDVCDCRSRREICDYWSFLASQHVKSREHERIVLADCLAVAGNNGEADCIHVLGETDVSVMLFDCATEISKVLRERFSRTWK